MTAATRTCRKCGQDKTLDAFAAERPLCRECQAAYRRAWYERNREKAKQQARRWEQENRERANELKRRWDGRNPEASAAAKRSYAESERGREMRKVYQARWRAANPEKVRLKAWLSNHRRRGMLAPDTIKYVEVLRSDVCAYCGGNAGHVDHIVPTAKGGDSTPANLTAACGPCNRQKNAMSLLAYLLYRLD